MRLLIKSRVKQPGKRGGKYWYDKHGNVQYGEKPNERQRKVQAKPSFSRKPLTAEEYKKHGVPEGAKHAYAYEKHDKYTHEWRDSRGKLQRKYQPKFVEQQQAEKYNRINNAVERIPELRESVNNDLNGKNRLRKYTALAVKIIDITGARVGTEKHTQDFDTHGITTLEKGNLIFKDDIAVLDYIGKKKVHQYHEIDDPEVVEALRELKKIPGKRLFQIDNRSNISAMAVNKYLSDYGLTAKDLRTFRANVEFTDYLCQQGVKKDNKERKKVVTEALKTVSETLGNTPNVCRTNYVSPEILNGYLSGEISLRFAINKGYNGKDYDELFTDEEQTFLDIWSEIAGKKEKGKQAEKIEKSHQRTTSTGKIVHVNPYQNTVVKKKPEMTIGIPLEMIERDEGQPRETFSQESLRKLGDSIKKIGLMQPIGVQPQKDGKYKIIFGERRWRASRIAGLKDIPARVFNVKDKKELFAIQVAENLAREEMNPIETANAYKKLYDVGMNYEEIAGKIGVSPLTVQRKMSLTTLIPEIQELIKNGDLSETKGILIGLAGLRSQFQFEVLKKINKIKKISKEELDGIVSRYKQAQDQTSLFAMDNRSVITGVSQINKNKVESVKRQLSTLLGSVVEAAEKIIDKNNYKLAPAILKEQGKLKRTKDELKLLQTYLGTIVKELESADAFFHSGGTVDQYLSKQGVKKESRKKRRKRVKKSVLYLSKSVVKQHTRKTKTGKITNVKQYINKKTKKQNKSNDYLKSNFRYIDNKTSKIEGYGKGLRDVIHTGRIFHSCTLEGLANLLNNRSDIETSFSTGTSTKLFGREMVIVLKDKERKGKYTPYDSDAGKNYGYDEFRTKFDEDDIEKVFISDRLNEIWNNDYEEDDESEEAEIADLLYEIAEDFAIKYSPAPKSLDRFLNINPIDKSIRYLLKGKVFPVGHVSVRKDGTIWKKIRKTGKPEDWKEIRGAAKKRVLAQRKGNITDFGKRIGGARKDTANFGFSKRGSKKKSSISSPWRDKYIVLKKVDGSGWTVGKKGDRYGFTSRSDMVFPTEKEAEKAIPLYAVAQSHSVFKDRDNKDEFAIYKRVGKGKLFKVVNKTFPSREDGMKYMAEHAEEILNIKTSFGEEILPVPEIAIRTGTVRRKGDATPKMFMSKFSPRGIEFGNWNNQDERQQVLNHTYDGLLDLADVLGVTPKDLMLGGELAIAFGARGQGLSGAKAHYERDYGVINLTKMKGAGSLAHEYFHALDHYLARKDTKSSPEKVKNKRGDSVYKISSIRMDFLSHGASYKSKLRPEIKDVYKKLMQTIYKKDKKYVEDKKQADKFVGKAKEQLKTELAEVRSSLKSDLTKTYTWRKNTRGLLPASAKQLAEYDKLANTLLEDKDRKIKYIVPETARKRSAYALGHRSNDIIEAISKIYKEVRNRSGFDSQNRWGALDRVASAMNMYDVRLQMFEDANKSTEKIKQVPTSYAMEAKKMDQARTSDYWGEPHEMVARAFSSYVEDKIAKKGNQSDFIVYRAHGGILLPMLDGFIAKPYPEGKERDVINKAFDNLFKIIRKNKELRG